MQALWAKSPMTADDVVVSIPPELGWNPRTVKTLINRLLKKGVLGYRKDGRRYLYFPKVDEDSSVRLESRTFVDRVFGGAVMPMLAMFLDEGELSPEQIRELREMLDARSRKTR